MGCANLPVPGWHGTDDLTDGRYNTPTCFSLPDSSACAKQVYGCPFFCAFKDTCILLSLCKLLPSETRKQNFQAQGLAFWNNTCSTVADICSSQKMEASSNSTCTNSSGTRNLINTLKMFQQIMCRGKCPAGGDLAGSVWGENLSKCRVLRAACIG